MSGHRHEFSALWDHYGPYGEQDAHFHVCFKCSKHLVGPGRDCDGKRDGHHLAPASRASFRAPVPVEEQ